MFYMGQCSDGTGGPASWLRHAYGGSKHQAEEALQTDVEE